MVRKTTLVVMFAMGVSGCMSTRALQSFVGQPIERVELANGAPANIVDLPNGLRAYQWQRTSSVVLPGSASTTVIGQSAYTSYTPAQQYNANCLYTVYTRDEGGEQIVVGFDKPRMMC